MRSNATAPEAFAEWADSFSERFFVILKVYADESEEHDRSRKSRGVQHVVIGGFLAEQENWKRFSTQWKKVLDKYKVNNFHFREFNSKDSCSEPESPYFKWEWEKRDNFFYELALTVGLEVLVPIGGDYPIKIHRVKGLTGDPYEWLFAQFFKDVSRAMNDHWPGFDERALFILDNGNSKAWREAAHTVHDYYKSKDARFGGLTFEDDTDPKHLGLQAADFLAALYRQAAAEKSRTGVKAKQRVVDLIVFRHLQPSNHPRSTARLSSLAFQLLISAFRKDEQRQKREWKANGLCGKPYFPNEHFPFEKFGITREAT